MMVLQQLALHLFSQLTNFTRQLSDEEFSRPLPVLGGSSLSMHQRHIISFYQCWLQHRQTGCICYDQRQRDALLEQSTLYNIEILAQLSRDMASVELKNTDVWLETDETRLKMKSSLARELYYCNEHAVHHMAMLRMASVLHFPEILLPADFGYAPSTLAWQKKTALLKS